MTQPENFTAAQASDPATPGQVLADIAALRPDLRAAVASNPSAYPGLIDWLKSLGEPAVDAAIAAREAAPAPTQQMPAQPVTPPAPQWAQQGQPAFSGAPAGMPPAGMPPQGMAPAGLPPQGMPPAGMPPQGMPAPGLQYGAPPAKKSNKALWIVLIIVGVLVLLGALGVFLVKSVFDKADDIIDDASEIIPDEDDLIPDETIDPTIEGGNHGDDPALDALWASCEDGDMAACDELYMASPFDSEYELFGDTCGERKEAGTDVLCVVTFGDGTETDTDADTDTDTSGEPFTYGDDPALDALWEACEGGDGAACDDLFWEAPAGSEYEDFGYTCGGREPDGAVCEQ